MKPLRNISWFLDRRSGFTLVEMLVVLVLMGLIAGSLAPNLAGATKQIQTDKLIADLIDLDAKARVLAGRHRVCYFEVEDAQSRITLNVIDEQAELLLVIEIPEFMDLTLDQDTDQNRMAMTFDRLGHTPDYRYTISVDDSTTLIGFNGLSGWHEVSREAHP